MAATEGISRRITGFHKDEAGDWVAELDCGHTQHVRHRPPFVNRPWTETAAGRSRYIGERLACRKCAEEGRNADP